MTHHSVTSSLSMSSLFREGAALNPILRVPFSLTICNLSLTPPPSLEFHDTEYGSMPLFLFLSIASISSRASKPVSTTAWNDVFGSEPQVKADIQFLIWLALLPAGNNGCWGNYARIPDGNSLTRPDNLQPVFCANASGDLQILLA